MHPSRLLALALITCGCACSAQAQIDSTVTGTPVSVRPSTTPNPRSALWRGAVLPGWGQIYNRQYYKLPFVYAGLGALATAAIVTDRRYLRYRHAYLFAEPLLADDDGNPTFPQYEDDYLALIGKLGLTEEQAANRQTQLAAQLKTTRDNLRRNRDLFYIGIGLFYGLSLLDAYVSAQLLDFDVSEDLAVRFLPQPGGLKATVRF